VIARHVTAGEEETRLLAAALARRLAPGGVVLLEGELGAGKTAFVKGLAEGLGLDPEDVSSPTFALVHEYGPDGRPPVLVHADFYRLAEGAPIGDLGLGDSGGAILAVEWPRPPFTSESACRVTLRFRPEGGREIEIEEPEGRSTG
jgi:tRNA threonylcarbamoyladenosine biosynthesis protein TsaE